MEGEAQGDCRCIPKTAETCWSTITGLCYGLIIFDEVYFLETSTSRAHYSLRRDEGYCYGRNCSVVLAEYACCVFRDVPATDGLKSQNCSGK